MQAAPAVFLVRPTRFGFNPETALSNHFQQELAHVAAADVQAQALAEFDAAVATLRGRGVEVLVFDDTPDPWRSSAETCRRVAYANFRGKFAQG